MVENNNNIEELEGEAKILDGKMVSNLIRESIKEEVSILQSKGEIVALAIVSVGDDPSSKIYIRNKVKASKKVGIMSYVYDLPSDTSEDDLLKLLDELNLDDKIDGIIVQLPLPKHIDVFKVQEKIDYIKDVDAFSKVNMGLLMQGRAELKPCTPAGIIYLLDHYGIDLWAKRVCIVGYSNIVGKPLSIMLSLRGATVTVCNSKTVDLPFHTRNSDIVIVATGKSHLIKMEHISKGAVVVDVGISRLDNGKIIGDVDFENVKSLASYITPVPGGIGPMTVAMLLQNTLRAHKLRINGE